MLQHHDLLDARQKLHKKHAPHNPLWVSTGTANNTGLCSPEADLETEHSLNVDAGVHASYNKAFAGYLLGDDVMAGRAGGNIVRVVCEEDGTAAHFNDLVVENGSLKRTICK